ncbi:hypothetical protein S40288_11049 [Stachybotrys chartarum IBT 40288]|nr:hypothetical protein S40288_11049 [Stachybotrys chartarum IBT 40288]
METIKSLDYEGHAGPVSVLRTWQGKAGHMGYENSIVFGVPDSVYLLAQAQISSRQGVLIGEADRGGLRCRSAGNPPPVWATRGLAKAAYAFRMRTPEALPTIARGPQDALRGSEAMTERAHARRLQPE